MKIRGEQSCVPLSILVVLQNSYNSYYGFVRELAPMFIRIDYGGELRLPSISRISRIFDLVFGIIVVIIPNK